MLFNSIDFLFFFPVITIVYFLVPKKMRTLWLLVTSYYFYSCWNIKYTALIAISTVITYISGILIGKAKTEKRKKGVVILSLISNILILVIFKYANFFLSFISLIAVRLGFSGIDKRLDLLLPVGISFYTFQALSYTLDTYKGKSEPEHNFIKYALFVSFFPQLVAGPIERTENLLPQINSIESKALWDSERIRDGILLMFWGYFQKLVIADRASILVNQVYKNYQSYGFVEIFIASVLFSIQIYCDFGGYTNIARGAAKVLDFSLVQNFRQPYFAISIKDFWRRWHLSLTSWFTYYLYIPLGGNRKGELRKYFNILIVFAVSGLWHGASWHFVAWGVLHAVLQIAGDLKNHLLGRVNIVLQNNASFSARLYKMISTFIMVNFAWIFFAADSISHAKGIIKQMFATFWTTSITEIGLDVGNWWTLFTAIGILAIVDIFHERKKSIYVLIEGQMKYLKYAVYLGLIWGVIMFGIYGVAYNTSQFIYFQF